jgi:hypothetical protein
VSSASRVAIALALVALVAGCGSTSFRYDELTAIDVHYSVRGPDGKPARRSLTISDASVLAELGPTIGGELASSSRRHVACECILQNSVELLAKNGATLHFHSATDVGLNPGGNATLDSDAFYLRLRRVVKEHACAEPGLFTDDSDLPP